MSWIHAARIKALVVNRCSPRDLAAEVSDCYSVCPEGFAFDGKLPITFEIFVALPKPATFGGCLTELSEPAKITGGWFGDFHAWLFEPHYF